MDDTEISLSKMKVHLRAPSLLSGGGTELECQSLGTTIQSQDESQSYLEAQDFDKDPCSKTELKDAYHGSVTQQTRHDPT